MTNSHKSNYKESILFQLMFNPIMRREKKPPINDMLVSTWLNATKLNLTSLRHPSDILAVFTACKTIDKWPALIVPFGCRLSLLNQKQNQKQIRITSFVFNIIQFVEIRSDKYKPWISTKDKMLVINAHVQAREVLKLPYKFLKLLNTRFFMPLHFCIIKMIFN